MKNTIGHKKVAADYLHGQEKIEMIGGVW